MFVILAYQRSGTHMLGTLLNSHPDLHCYDEVLLTKRPPDNLLLGRKKLNKLNKNEGCIVMYNYFLRATKKEKEIICNSKVIHLLRTNTNNHIKSLIKKGKFPKNFNFNRAAKIIHGIRRLVFKYDFKQIYEITYEEICKDKNIKKYKNDDLLNFLGVKPLTLTTELSKGYAFN